MRASIRRIDLTQQPARVDLWPSTEWLSADIGLTKPAPVGPQGRGGLWVAMARAVARAREASMTTSWPDGSTAEALALADPAPHLVYLARVAGGVDDHAGGHGADGPLPA
jgi:hypothetical protein